ncbi:PepSY-associated TM helix domain-containing protein [Mucilaginibacter auburnensis]|uniref:Putative iron-regulated membrane protein n=1 Tax=Mucilaginibacter auburnensis TaxID=1457233 RepID=A0A2H9VRS2_9SPHI|nr:PepSY domain-containing protein [Mucilaginibacter auburnensis]PJJ83526.1 putative iron-regulated membrane protein [Mucilaginibacter auburnensis]
MATIKSVKRWFWWHKWTSLICTAFLLLLCLTGLPLIFHEEIEELTEAKKELTHAPDAKPVPVDEMVKTAVAHFPGKVAKLVVWDKEHPGLVNVTVGDSPSSAYQTDKYVAINAYTGEIEDTPVVQEGFMWVMLRLHVDLFAGIPGKLLMALMGILFVIAIVSGIVLYGPIMKKFDFGMIRTEKSSRVKWLDMHNLLGIVTLTWATVVGLTGVINALGDVMLYAWQQGQLTEMTAPYKNAKPLTGELSSLDDAMKIVQQREPEMQPYFVAFPGTMYSSKHHYAVFVRGNTPLTERLLKPALIDAQTGQLTDMREMPFFVNAYFISQPLHFGDYGGMPLKMIWALFDIATIVVLISGLYLWFARRKSSKEQLARMEASYNLTATI